MRAKLTKGVLLLFCVLGAVSGWFVADGAIEMGPAEYSALIGYGIIFASAFLFTFVLRLRDAK